MFIESLFKSRKLSLLILAPVIAVALVSLNAWLHLDAQTIAPVKSWITNYSMSDKMTSVIWGIVVVVLAGTIFFFIAMRFRLFPEYSMLPDWLYVLFVSGIIWQTGFSYAMIAGLMLMFALNSLFPMMLWRDAYSGMFNIGCYLSVAVIFYPKLLILYVWALFALIIIGRSSLRAYAALILGVVTPLCFLAFYYYWIDAIPSLVENVRLSLWHRDSHFLLTYKEITLVFALFFLFLICLPSIMRLQNTVTENQRCNISVLLLLVMTLAVSAFVVPGIGIELLYVVSVPLSYLFAFYFVIKKVSKFQIFMFMVIVLDSIALAL